MNDGRTTSELVPGAGGAAVSALGGSYANLCRACGGTDFASVSAFDRHRTGDHELDWSEHENGRRCRDTEEMLEAGLELDPRGRWRIVLNDEQRERLRELKGSRLPAFEGVEG
jgi:hypothetical protein